MKYARNKALYGAATVVTVAAVLTTAACSASATGGTTAASAGKGNVPLTTSATSVASACQLAQSKGQTVVDYDAGTDAPTFAKEVAGFEKAYPWMKVNFTSVTPAVEVNNVLAQVQAHHALNVDADNLDPTSAALIYQHGEAYSVDWGKMGVSSDLLVTMDGVSSYRGQRDLGGLGYNPKVISASELPSTWQGLIDPKYAGKISYDPRGIFLSPLALAWGEAKFEAWFKQFLAVDKPKQVLGITVGLQKVSSGEVPITTNAFDSEVDQQQAAGAPVAIKYLTLIPTQDTYETIFKNAPHPYAAACFLDWWASPDGGQAAQAKYEYKVMSSRPAATPAGATLVYPKTTADLILESKATAAIATPGSA